MSAHTPGPWTLDTVRTSCGLCHKVGPFLWKDGKTNHACVYDDYPGYGDGTPELVANARLIAAAPELLEAVIHLSEALEDGHWQNTKEHLRELIAKATGAA